MAVRVDVTWWLEDGLLHGQAELVGLDDDILSLHAVNLPDITLPHGSETTLFVPEEMGVEVSDAAGQLVKYGEAAQWRIPYPGLYAHMQCLGWRDEECGVYLDSRDDKGWAKEWIISAPGENLVRLQLGHLAPRRLDRPGEFALPYASTLGVFTGGWFGLGQIYRSWAKTTPWFSRGPAERRDNFIADIACWVWNRGHSEDVCEPVKVFAERLGLPVALDWYWWHKHPYDTGYPEYFPPREGVDQG